ncbi:HTH domain protein [Natrialba magadii ATCC 43099]|uniref:HTH domain protein n=1 Tax=Natrialba magadii (strain ATCC 43099 / DSM 3394 / CCM 3739 / CIP 104546 / IAM 13178 / JCM 8861 / NBRC 102185 / NCIMB 2190 / MS3) TaxID=547559 RepID=D3SWQ7_NATMM|nr:HTH domain-containing protein [Natrialba magadii]ADD05789.1 HTH domain protein [Natrialba magadii ATCC 43099]ELY30135.1 transcriptional regulator [Natrialba magadii ATCC 43099]
MDSIEKLELLVRSPVRIQLLEHLSAQPATVNQLESEFDVHRRTIIRNLDSLETSGWVAVHQRNYHLTPAVELFLTELIDVLDRLSTASQLAAFFEYVPPEDIDIPLSAFKDITVVRSDSDNPHDPLMTVQEAVSMASTIRMVIPVVSPIYAQIYAEAIADNSIVETVLTAGAAKALQEGSNQKLDAILDDSDARTYLVDRKVPYGLLITDQSVLVGGYDDGVLRVVLEGDSPPFRQWARTAYAHQQEVAKQLA